MANITIERTGVLVQYLITSWIPTQRDFEYPPYGLITLRAFLASSARCLARVIKHNIPRLIESGDR